MERWVLYVAAAAAFCICGSWGYRQGMFERELLSDEGLARQGIKLERVEGSHRFYLVYYCHSRVLGFMSLAGHRPFVAAERMSEQHRFLAPLFRSYYGYARSIFRSPTVFAANWQRLEVLGEPRSHHRIVLAGFSGWAIGHELAMSGRERCDGPAILAKLRNPRLWRERFAYLSRNLALQTLRNAREKVRRGAARPNSTPSVQQLIPIALRFNNGHATVAELDLLTKANGILKQELRSPFRKMLDGVIVVMVIIWVLVMAWLISHQIREHRRAHQQD